MITRPKGGDYAPRMPNLWKYDGSEEGRETLRSLQTAKCPGCGATHLVDDSPTGLSQRCACGTLVG